jgi:hypothetical protein
MRVLCCCLAALLLLSACAATRSERAEPQAQVTARTASDEPTLLSDPPRPPAPPCDNVVCVDRLEWDSGVHLVVTNWDSVAQYVTFTLSLENMYALGEEPYLTRIEPGERRHAIRILARDASLPWRYRYRYRWRPDVRTASLRMHSGPPLAPAETPDLEMIYRGDSARIVVDAVNGLYAPMTLALTSPDSAYAPLAPSFVVGARDIVRVFDGAPPPGWMDVPEREALFLRQSFVVGHVGAQHDPNAQYRLPALPGDTLRVKFSGESVTFYEATLAAARAGRVVQIQDGTEYDQRALTRLTIVHDDGTQAYYSGWTGGSLRVRPGDRVEAGDALAEARPDGWTFVVKTLTAAAEPEYVPVCFQTAAGERCELEEGEVLLPPLPPGDG